jgi:hypothetical protein
LTSLAVVVKDSAITKTPTQATLFGESVQRQPEQAFGSTGKWDAVTHLIVVLRLHACRAPGLSHEPAPG